MEGPKRVQFTTIETNQKEEKKTSPRKTVRFNLDLPDTTDTTCPEFSFNELLKNVSGPGDEKSSDDPFGDEDDADKLAAIARSFEEKYNSKPKLGKKKKNKDYLEDLVDLGDGYDETDTFIDNSEAYDEVVPATITTKLGGFYINSGKLDFREISDDSDNDFQPPSGSAVKKKQKKRRISSDDESGEENKKLVKKKKLKDSLALDGEVKKKKKKKLLLPDGAKPAKKPNLTQDKDKTKSNKSSTVSALLKSTSPQQNGENLPNGLLSPGETNDSEDSMSEAINSVASGAKEDSNSQAEFEDTRKEIDPEKVPKLPPSLPAELEKTIESLKNSAKETQGGKCKFFTGNVNKLLLDVELASLQMTCGARSSMYAHLAAHLPCSKDTLLKRAKTLRVKEMDDKIKGPLEKLKDAVNRVMPALQQKYAADLKAAQEKAAQEKLISQEKPEEDRDASPTRDKTGDSDNDEGKTNQNDPAKKKFVVPPKRFAWDSTLRSLLCDVVKVKMEMYEVSKVRSQTVDEYLRTFLEKEVRPIWPKGWMQLRILIKESRPAHMKWTSGQKPKKNVLVTKTPGSAPPVGHVTKAANQGSAPAGIPSSKVTLTGSSKHTPLVADSAKSVVHLGAENTPLASVKKMIPTILDYTNDNIGKNSADILPHSANNSNLGSNTKVPSASSSLASKMPDSNPSHSKPLAESWNHKVADILKQSLNQTSNKPVTQTLFQRQNSHENTFLAQFQNFTATAAAFQHSANKLPSPKDTGQGQQKTGRANSGVDLSPPKAHHSQGHMTPGQQEKFLKEAQERNIQRLIEQQLDEKKKIAAQQTLKLLNLATSSSRNPETVVKNIGKSGQIHGAGDSVSKQSSSLKQMQIGQNVSVLTENVIRQQLDKHVAGTPSSVSKNSGQPTFSPQAALAEHLRKASPQSSAVSTNASLSQGKSQVIRMSKVQGQSHSTSQLPAGMSATNLMQTLFGQAKTNSNQTKPYTGISSANSSQSAPYQSSPHNALNPSRSHLSSSNASSPVTQVATPKWNPASVSLPGYNGAADSRRPSFDGAGDGSNKHYLDPAASPHTGYQNVKLSNLSSEQMATFKQHPGLPAQAHRSPDSNRYGNQMVPHTSPGTHPPHLSPHKQQRSSLNYGYPYPDTLP